jgi:hypothetical protein
MKHLESESRLRDETTLRWSCLEDEREACVVVSERMELVYINAAARQLVLPGEWFGKRCFEVLPIVDETCAFHCPKIQAVNESLDVVYCEETVCLGNNDRRVFGVGLIPLGPGGEDHARAVLLLRGKEESGAASAFQAQLLTDAKSLARRIASASRARSPRTF